MRAQTRTVGLLLFGSGFCALVYQIGWLREFRLIFGASTAASAAVLAIFIGGLGIGSLLLGPRADAQERPLVFYSNLEATIAVCAALSPPLLALVRLLYIASGGSATLGIFVATLGRLVLSALVLAIPTIAMGGTLPAAARAVTRAGDARRRDVAVLYAVNTLGAVAGAALATFWMLELFGTHRTLWLAAAVNLLIAVAARSADRGWAGKAGEAGQAEGAALPAPPALPALAALPGFVIVASATVGFAFFLLELIWYRLLGPLLGGSAFTFGLVLAVALAGVGIGGLAYALTSEDRPATLVGFATSCLLEAVAVALGYALGDRLATLALVLLPLRAAGFTGAVAGWTIVVSLVVLPPAVVAGYQFPMLIALFGRGSDGVGRHVGLAYAANTVGAIAGSLAGGFGILPWLSAPVAWKLVAIVLVALGVGAIAVATPRRIRDAWPAALAAAAAVALLFAPGPSAFWRHGGIGAGRTPGGVVSSANDLHAWMATIRRSVVWETDGVESSIALTREPSGYAFIVNGKSDGSARGDATTQVMLGLIGALRQPAAKRALVIGLGTGSSAGWLAAIPAMERVDVVELEPAVLNVARACAAVNHDALANPKLHATIGDARETLLTGRDRYDLIASEPSNPFRAGIASLFTEEYYRAARARLTADGVFVQWVQAYEIDTATLQTIYATLGAVFPHIETWQTNRDDLVLVATGRSAPYDTAALAARIGQEPFRSALTHVWRVLDLNGVFAHFIANDRFGAAVAHGDVDRNTDDRNVVEFGLARSVGGRRATLAADIRGAALAMGAARPPLDRDEAVVWPVVDTEWASFSGWDTPAAMTPAAPPERSRRAALELYFAKGDIAAVRELWRQQSDPPRGPSELVLAADIQADAGSDAARPLIGQLRAYEPAEADVLTAVLDTRQGHDEDAAAALEAAFVRMRSDPWPLLTIKQRALSLAAALGVRPAIAHRLYAVLDQPFALDAVDDQRLLTRVDLAARTDFAAMCAAPIGALEPHAVWSASFLQLRRTCYQTVGDARLPHAVRDLQTFFADAPQPIVLR